LGTLRAQASGRAGDKPTSPKEKAMKTKTSVKGGGKVDAKVAAY
jgi:hypothetical protein